MSDSVLVIGAGSFGTAVARHLSLLGHDVTLFTRRAEHATAMRDSRRNADYLPDVALPESMTITSDLPPTLPSWVFCGVPTRYLRDSLTDVSADHATVFVSLAKGIERETLAFPTRVIADATGATHVCTLSGPSHAEEVAQGLPCALVAAGNADDVNRLQALINSDSFRVYTSTDCVGVELAAASKNVVAIAAGIVDGLGLGDNAKAALLARGLAEITRLGAAMGADPRSFYGLAGIGDLYTTCASPHGRNRRFGVRVGKGETPTAIIESSNMVVEGYNTAGALRDLASRHAVEMPIVNEVCRVIYDGESPRAAVQRLMTRESGSE